MNFPRYFDVTLDGERYPALVEVATDREVELWDPAGWEWSLDFLVFNGFSWRVTVSDSRFGRLRRWLSDAMRPSPFGF